MQIDYHHLQRLHLHIKWPCLNPQAPGMNMQGSNLSLHDLGMTTQGSHLKMQEPGVTAQESYFPAQRAGPLKQPTNYTN